MTDDWVPSSEAVRTGKINIPKCQYNILPEKDFEGRPVKSTFMPVFNKGGLMYRWKGAPLPLVKEITTSHFDEEDGHDWFKILVDNFMNKIYRIDLCDLIEGDDDEEYTYGAFCTALATMGLSETDWILTRAFADVYEVRRLIPSDIDSEG